ncbi:unnamed protein product [Pedinophyceae sp. YPF-701]|nr:unnamed protein product [Pedinophyceae sp. YPF-701]
MKEIHATATRAALCIRAGLASASVGLQARATELAHHSGHVVSQMKAAVEQAQRDSKPEQPAARAGRPEPAFPPVRRRVQLRQEEGGGAREEPVLAHVSAGQGVRRRRPAYDVEGMPSTCVLGPNTPPSWVVKRQKEGGGKGKGGTEAQKTETLTLPFLNGKTVTIPRLTLPKLTLPGTSGTSESDASAPRMEPARPTRTPHTLPAKRHNMPEHERLWREGLAKEAALQMNEARDCYRRAVEACPGISEYWSRLAKVTTDCQYTPGTTPEAARALHRNAIEVAKEAQERFPDSSLGPVAECFAKGRLALLTDRPKDKLQLAKEARECAVRAMAIDPTDDVACHVMGRWHYEMASLNFAVRAVIQVLFGTSLPSGSYEGALDCYLAAVKHNPARLVHRVEAARCMTRLGRDGEAREFLEPVFGMHIEDINAKMTLRDAETMRAKLRPADGAGGGRLSRVWRRRGGGAKAEARGPGGEKGTAESGA